MLFKLFSNQGIWEGLEFSKWNEYSCGMISVHIWRQYRRKHSTIIFSSVQLLSRVLLFVTPCIPVFSVRHQLLELAQIQCPSSRWCHPTISSSVFPFSSCFQSFPASGFFFFPSESVLHIRWPKYWSFSFSISTSSEYSGMISFRIDWFDLLAVQGTLKSLLQHHSSKPLILHCSVFFMVQLSHPYMTSGKTIDLTTQAFVGKVTSLLFNMPSRLVIVFLPRSKRVLISWL